MEFVTFAAEATIENTHTPFILERRPDPNEAPSHSRRSTLDDLGFATMDS